MSIPSQRELSIKRSIIKAIETGSSVSALAQNFGISKSSIYKYRRSLRDLGYIKKNENGVYVVSENKFSNRLTTPKTSDLDLTFKEETEDEYINDQPIKSIDTIENTNKHYSAIETSTHKNKDLLKQNTVQKSRPTLESNILSKVQKKSIFITGCSHGGIGYATAKHLKEKGYRVFTSARQQKNVSQLQEEGFESYLVDVNNYEQVDAALNDILIKTSGTLDAVFNNAGFGQAGALEDIHTQTLKDQFDTNVFALHNITKKAIKIMRKQGHGKIIQHSSVLGLISMKYKGAYISSKYALEGLADTMRLELKGSNIYISTLNTGPITSNFRKNYIKTIGNIEYNNSYHLEKYETLLSAKHKKAPFNRDAKYIAIFVEKILRTSKPKPRYYITKATWIMAILKRILPTKILDKFLQNK